MLVVKSSYKKSLSFFFLFWYPYGEWTYLPYKMMAMKFLHVIVV